MHPLKGVALKGVDLGPSRCVGAHTCVSGRMVCMCMCVCVCMCVFMHVRARARACVCCVVL